ncbi:MAG: cysteine--tRNA ligase [Patescibacteria group bacterium]|nr:MAG: cysteine--tRNA ligase [Patescibacteria group bacterium]
MKKSLKIYNSLTRKKEEFKPHWVTMDGSTKVEPSSPHFVRMYVCGPTVYGPSHIGHARTYTNFDFLKRALEYNGYTVRHVLNITDIHDSMIEEAQRRGVTVHALADRYIKHFYRDLEKLNIESPDVFPRVSDHIKEIIQMIKELMDKGYAYEREGSVYFDVSKFESYGKLSGVKLTKAKTGTRIAADKYEREEVIDFSLWKKAEVGEDKVGAVWDSPWGKGRPGWHIECSVMSRVHLGETLDIHGGALDLRFPHHENEIAQSETATGRKFANYWVHAGLLTVEGKKMAKSLNNYIEFDALVRRGFDPLAFRYLCLTTHYRGELNFTWAGLEAAQIALRRLYDRLSMWDPPGSSGCAEYDKAFDRAIDDDLDLPKALTLVWKLVKDDRFKTAAKHRTLLKMDKVLGLKLAEVEHLKVSAEVLRLVEERERLRIEEDWVGADEIRDRMEQRGYRVEDTDEGPIVKKVR